MAVFRLVELKLEEKRNWAYARKMEPELSSFHPPPLGRPK